MRPNNLKGASTVARRQLLSSKIETGQKRQMSGRLKFISRIIFSLIIFVGGYLILHLTIRGLWLAKVSAGWPTVEGQITSSFVQENRGRWATYSPKISYRYSVNNLTLEGNVIGYGQPGLGAYTESRDKAEAKIAQYPLNQTVIVYYDPQAPNRPCLEPARNDFSVYFWQCLGSLMMLLGFIVAKGAYHRFNLEYRFSTKR